MASEQDRRQGLQISGSGGKGASPRQAVEAPDSLRSIAEARVLDLLCEGEVEGFSDPDNPLTCVYLNDTPLANANGTLNFSSVSVDFRYGLPNQTYLKDAPVGNLSSLPGVEVKKYDLNGDPTFVSHQINDLYCDVARITVAIDALYSQDKSNGDVNGTFVEFKISYTPDGGSETFLQRVDTVNTMDSRYPVYTDVFRIEGKTMSRYYRSVDVELGGTGPWMLKMYRVTEPAADSSLKNSIVWAYTSEITYLKLNYPNRAVVSVGCDAANFPSVPKRGYKLKLKRVKVPTNYFPLTKTYTRLPNGTDSGVEQAWDGQFYTAWTDNPAWCYYDLLTNERFGLGKRVSSSLIDKWGLYTIARYCDEPVPNGFGGMEPRFRLNCYIQERVEAQKLLSDLASVFRGMAYWAGGQMMTTCDMPSEPKMIFNPTNVVNGDFVYQGSARRTRHTVALVTWNDPDDMYRQKVEYIEDIEGIKRYGVQPVQVVSFGATSRGQARRTGRWILYSEQWETETVSFRTGFDAAYCRPGEVIAIADPARAGKRLGGRVKSVVGRAVYLDTTTTLDDSTYNLYVLASDGTIIHKPIEETGGTLNYVTVTDDFTVAPDAEAVWILECNEVEPQLFRVVSVANPEPHQVEITALAHNPSKYNAVEFGDPIQELDISDLPDSRVSNPPQNLNMRSELCYVAPSVIGSKLVAFWDVPVDTIASRYEVRWKAQFGNWVDLPSTQSLTVEVKGITVPGYYEVEVVAVNMAGVRSAAAWKGAMLYGKEDPPADVELFYPPIIVAGWIEFDWKKVPDLDVVGYEIRSGDSWDDAGATIVNPSVKEPPFQWRPTLEGSLDFWIKAIDASGNKSLNATRASVSVSKSRVTGITPEVIDNNVMLKWTAVAGTYPIDHYLIYKGSITENNKIGQSKGTFTALFESQSGTFTYIIVPVDTTGLVGTGYSLPVMVTAPSDYVLRKFWQSDFSGTKTNVALTAEGLFGPVHADQTFQEHFTEPGYTHFDDFSDAGYTNLTTPQQAAFSPGTYAETFDYGANLTSTMITVVLEENVIYGTPSRVCKIETSTDNSNWTTYDNTTQVYAPNFRYVKVTLTFTADTASAILNVSKMTVTLNLKEIIDSGTGTITDAAAGLHVNFNKSFKAVGQPGIRAVATVPRIGVADCDGMNPEAGFTAYLYDLAGNKVTGQFSWDVKGV